MSKESFDAFTRKIQAAEHEKGNMISYKEAYELHRNYLAKSDEIKDELRKNYLEDSQIYLMRHHKYPNKDGEQEEQEGNIDIDTDYYEIPPEEEGIEEITEDSEIEDWEKTPDEIAIEKAVAKAKEKQTRIIARQIRKELLIQFEKDENAQKKIEKALKKYEK